MIEYVVGYNIDANKYTVLKWNTSYEAYIEVALCIDKFMADDMCVALNDKAGVHVND